MGKYIFGFAVVPVVPIVMGTAHTAYNVWALRILWNTWLSEYFILTVPAAVGVCLVAGWTRGYKHKSEKKQMAYAKGWLAYETVQPALLVTISEICKWYLM